jgi:cellulose synthase/poly-beta-1,6-N-acetylglucosamine synthase-like glycosyltransferase
MLFVIFLLNSLLLGVALINFASIRRPSPIRTIDKSVVVLLPVRNEAENIDRILSELALQQGIPNYRVLVINDNSTDATRTLAEKHQSSTIEIIDAPEPQSGWLGKVSALHYGFSHLPSADIYISIDADVHFYNDSIARATATLVDSDLAFISPYPQQIALTWGERLVQPLLQWSWMSTVLLRGAERVPLESTVICNGQFLVMGGDELRSIDGFSTVSHQVLDDIELGRSFVRAGYRGAVIEGSSLASTQMYQSFSEIKAGYGKSLHRAFGSIVGSTFAALFIFSTGVIPFIYALSGNLIAIAATVAIISTRIVSAVSSSGRLRDSFLHPLSSLLFLYLLYFSWSNRGKVQWKGRTL